MIFNTVRPKDLSVAFNPSRQQPMRTQPTLLVKSAGDTFQLTFSGHSAKSQLTEALDSRSANHNDANIGRLISQCSTKELSTPCSTTCSAIDRQTPLHVLSSAGKADLVQLILNKKVDPDISGPSGITPLRDAAISGNVGTVKNLLNAGATVDHKGRDGETALSYAVYYARPDVTQVLLNAYKQQNLDFTKESTEPGKTLLHRMIEGSDYNTTPDDIKRTAEALVNAGLDLNQQGIYGSTPLTLAVGYARPVAVEGLLQAGANPNVPDAKGKTPLMRAQRYENITSILKKYGAKDQSEAPAKAPELVELQKASGTENKPAESVEIHQAANPLSEPADDWDMIDPKDVPVAAAQTSKRKFFGI